MEHPTALQSLVNVAAAPLIAAMVGGSVVFFLGWIYQAGLDQFFQDVGHQQKSALVAVESVLIQRIAGIVRGFIPAERAARLKKRMIMAGLDMRDSLLRKPEDFVAVQILASMGGGLFFLYMWTAVKANPILILFGVVVGFWFPNQWLSDQIKKRHLLITRALPYNLDLLTLSVEAGLDFTAALAKVVERGRKGPLLDELALVLRQLKMGKTRAECLKIMVDRVQLSALSTFVSALIQADKMGTPLGKVLRIQSAQLRVERSQRAEKLAGEAPVKMLGPLVMCIMPTVFLILFGPVIFAMKYSM